MTETATNYNVDAIASELTELEQLNLKVAAIAGWTDIKVWDNSRSQERKPKKRLFVGNHDRKELGIFIPDYANDLNAISPVITHFGYGWSITSDGDAFITCGLELVAEICEKTPAIALCKLLLELNPKPETKPEVIEATFG